MLKTVPLCLCAAALALGGCNQSASQNNAAAPAQSGKGTATEAGDKTIAATLDQNGKFFQAAKAVGLDATLAGAGPYTVLVPDDAAFGKAEGDALKDPAKPENRAEITRILTYHILPGVVLADDINKAIEAGKGKAVLATMGGQNLTATKDGGTIILSGDGPGKARITQADTKASNGVIHSIDAVLVPPKTASGGGSGQNGG